MPPTGPLARGWVPLDWLSFPFADPFAFVSPAITGILQSGAPCPSSLSHPAFSSSSSLSKPGNFFWFLESATSSLYSGLFPGCSTGIGRPQISITLHSALIPSYGCSSPQPSSAPSASHTSCRILLPELASRFLRCCLHLRECSTVSRSMSCRAAALLCSLPGPPLPGFSLGSRSLSQWEDLCWALHEPAGLVLRWGSQLFPM